MTVISVSTAPKEARRPDEGKMSKNKKKKLKKKAKKQALLLEEQNRHFLEADLLNSPEGNGPSSPLDSSDTNNKEIMESSKSMSELDGSTVEKNEDCVVPTNNLKPSNSADGDTAEDGK